MLLLGLPQKCTNQENKEGAARKQAATIADNEVGEDEERQRSLVKRARAGDRSDAHADDASGTEKELPREVLRAQRTTHKMFHQVFGYIQTQPLHFNTLTPLVALFRHMRTMQPQRLISVTQCR